MNGRFEMTPERLNQLADMRERRQMDELEASRERERARKRGNKIRSELESAGLVILPRLLNKCCGNIPSHGIRRGKPFVSCPWCKSAIEANTAAEAVRIWNNPTKQVEK